jgi:hypothetical protein
MRSWWSVSQQRNFPPFLDPKLHYRVHQGRPLVRILSQLIMWTHSQTSFLRSISKLFSNLLTDISLGFWIKILCAFVIFPMCVTCSTHLNLLDYINLAICGEEYKLWSLTIKCKQCLDFYVPRLICSYVVSRVLRGFSLKEKQRLKTLFLVVDIKCFGLFWHNSQAHNIFALSVCPLDKF